MINMFSMYWRVRGIVLLRWLLVWCPHYYTLLGTFWYVVTAAYPAQIYPFACADRAADAGALNLLQVSFRVILDHMEMILRDLRLFWDYNVNNTLKYFEDWSYHLSICIINSTLKRLLCFSCHYGVFFWWIIPWCFFCRPLLNFITVGHRMTSRSWDVAVDHWQRPLMAP